MAIRRILAAVGFDPALPQTHEYPLDHADRALADLKAGRFDGASVRVS